MISKMTNASKMKKALQKVLESVESSGLKSLIDITVSKSKVVEATQEALSAVHTYEDMLTNLLPKPSNLSGCVCPKSYRLEGSGARIPILEK